MGRAMRMVVIYYPWVGGGSDEDGSDVLTMGRRESDEDGGDLLTMGRRG